MKESSEEERESGLDPWEESPEEELEAGRGLHTEAQVVCPYCGEQLEITLDPGGA